ncbi:actin-related protein 10 [Thrips palmi]|uniref:Actin-related protein 10 n=1 Tax=Thrips palmi TaxID=161013 RepID=A0A6P9AC75_THRPL|nr:actin-related protein 10 [Thrips palmi]XP_034254969.1 actin-related protein 10 [Thrips palmi]
MIKTFYEGGMGLTSEKQSVVFDFGVRFTKAGFAGEAAPRCIVRTEVRCSRSGQMRKVFDALNSDEQYDLLVDFIHNLYFRHLLVSPKDRRVVVVESVLCPTAIREMLAKVLFMHFEVSSLLFVPSHVVALSTLGVNTALVVDMGAVETVVIPVHEGVAVLHAWQAQPLAANAVESQIKEMLSEREKSKPSEGFANLTEANIEDIKVRACFVTTLQRTLKAEEGKPCPSPPSVKYLVGPDSHILNISGDIRENSFNVLFQQDADQISVSTMILDAIIKCPIDMRKPLAENILLIGGTSMAIGMGARIKEELEFLSASPQYSERLKIRSFQFHSPPAKGNYTAWLGGAIYGATDFVTIKSLSKEAYLRERKVPDWVSLIHNTYNAGTKRSV